MKQKLYLCYIVLLFIVFHTKAQFTISGEIRPRAEFRNGFKRLTSQDLDPAFFIEQRSRLYFNFKDEKFAFRISLQDVRIWGENAQVFKSDNALFNVNEAWGQYNFSPKTSIRVGRQELDYDNARILGNLAWAAQSRSHDVLKFQYSQEGTTLDLGFAYNQEDVLSKSEPARLTGNFYATGGNYKTMQYAWYHRDFDQSKYSLLFLNNGVQSLSDSSVYFSQTLGINGTKKIGKTDLSGELYYQFGKDGGGTSINAFLASLSLTFNAGSLPLTIGADILSGSEPGSDKNKSFNPLYGTHHKFYGFMDYFYVGNPHGNKGIQDFYIKTKFKTGEKSVIILDLHEFFSDATIMDGDSNELSSTLGTEVDMVFNLNISKEVNFKLGYSQLFATDSMEAIKGGDKSEINNWAWTMLTIKPTLFSK